MNPTNPTLISAFALALAISLVAAGCDKPGATAVASDSQPSKGVQLPDDAKKLFEQQLAIWIPSRGESRFTKFSHSGGGYTFAGNMVTEWKKSQLTFTYHGKGGAPLTDADIANGVTEWWEGQWTRSICREFFIPWGAADDPPYEEMRWGEWADSPTTRPTLGTSEVRVSYPASLPWVVVARKHGELIFNIGSNKLVKWKDAEIPRLPK